MTAATEEYRKFKCSDDKEFEMSYFGPTGSGDGRNPVGCKGFFQKLNCNVKEMDEVRSAVEMFQEYMSSKRSNDRDKKNSTLADRLYTLITALSAAFRLSE